MTALDLGSCLLFLKTIVSFRSGHLSMFLNLRCFTINPAMQAYLSTRQSEEIKLDAVQSVPGYTCFSRTNREIQGTPAGMETAHKEEAKSALHDDGGQSSDELDPWNPPRPPWRPTPPDADLKSRLKLLNEWLDEKDEVVATSRRTKIITRDPTPESVDVAFSSRLSRLMPIFEKDNVRSFLRLYQRNDYGLVYGFIIAPITFTQIVKHNALKCAKVALEGKARDHGWRANPNCMNRDGYFPLHEATELFSVDMIKLLFRYGANANVRTTGAEVIEGLLPLHVAVENTCLHKYLEGNAFPTEEDLHNSQATVKYICKLIHLLCLPEMKIFLDTVRLLGEHTDSLVDELWNYIKHGLLVQTAILLLATQEQIRGGFPCKINDNRKPDGFSIIINRILSHTLSLTLGMDQKGKKKRQPKVEKKLSLAASLLVHVVSQVGKRPNKYILSHPEVMNYLLLLQLKRFAKCAVHIKIVRINLYYKNMAQAFFPVFKNIFHFLLWVVH
ncbi:hypothetical protein U9M48_034351 [Paspalum notatum var. saurae]|uniref:Uncharacterized protein n=1 Tax=Paspalum notatum var. saurae TaxID=547442 RepID=A0AAQ3X8U3_PASNO